jgi:hypothetical protein
MAYGSAHPGWHPSTRSDWRRPPVTGEDGPMSDDIEKLLAEVSKTSSPTAPTSGSVAPTTGSSPAKKSASARGGRLAFALVSAAIFGGSAFVVGWLFTPFVLTGTSMGLGAALGSFLTGLIAGPPRWFSS